MKTLASRTAPALFALVAVALGAAGPAFVQRAGAAVPDPTNSPTPTPLLSIASPPPTVGSAGAAGACANDAFLAFRTVPAPIQNEVTICGTVTDAGTAVPPTARGAARPAFYVNVDGTAPIGVVADGAAPVTPHRGDVAIVRGRYHRDNGGGEGIDSTHTGTTRGWAYDGYVMLNGTIYR